MIPQNRYLWIEPVLEGMIAGSSGNEYIAKNEVTIDPKINIGDTIIVEEQNVIKVMANGKETFFVREQDILAIVPIKE